MKKYILTFIVILCGTVSFAQDLDSIIYIQPEFDYGYIFSNDGSVQQGCINICNIDQNLRHISSGDTLIVDATDVLKVVLNGKTYYRFDDSFTEIIDLRDVVSLGVQKHATIIDNAKIGAYGSSATSATQSYNGSMMYGMDTKYIDSNPENYNLVETYVLFKNDRFYRANRKGFMKCFPEHKNLIKEEFKKGTGIKEIFNKIYEH